MTRNRQLDRVRDAMSDGQWHSLRELADVVGCLETSVSARIRDMRKPECGAHVVDKVQAQPGLWLYRLHLVPEQMELIA